MAPSGGDPYRSPPIIRKRSSFPLTVMLRKLLGIIGFVKKKSRRWSYVDGCCTHQWPISGTDPDLAGIVVSGAIDLDYLNNSIQRVLVDSRSNLFENANNDVTANIGKLWDHSNFRVATDADLLTLQQQDNVLPLQKTTLSLVPEFVHSLKRLTSSSLVLTSTAADCAYVCVQRLLCMLMNERASFEMEPYAPLRGWQQQIFGCFPQTAVCMSVKFVMGGPFSLLLLALRGQHPVWKYLESKDNVSGRNRRRLKVLTHRSSSSVLMDSAPDDPASDARSPALGDRSLLSRNVPSAAAHHRRWMSVKHPELILRAEKLLRSSSSELFLALIAGALRNHFREQGILHPPDLGCVAPSSSRGCPPIGDRCDTSLLPFQLPTSVEGAIPRLWAVQRNIAKAIEGSTSGAVTIVQGIARNCLPASLAKSTFRVVYRSHAVYFALYRTSVNRISPNAAVQTIFIFPSLVPTVRAAFVFIQHDTGIDMTVSLCSRTFPNPERVLESFQRETRLLLDHLSLRLLSLPETTVLPGVPACLRHERTENEMESEMFGSASFNLKITHDPLDQNGHDYSLEELYRLLDVVQTELDSMRCNPEVGLRSHYIDRLTRLEEKMQNFHECISQKLSAEKMEVPGGSGDSEVGDAIANVLAPYRDEPGTSGARRFSREYARTETSTSRKSSRASL
ncbi:hypothetical protein RB195_012352 [Necator americanus]|uniref:O-acyltransferase WSD1 C-terminal domain-containing protein n=1 Tax=Necator americanus TaxID=51031 RepID=A0ABR1D6T1_NECAM